MQTSVASTSRRKRLGRKYMICATLVGPTGASATLVSVWVVRAGEDFARFVTAYPEGGR